MLLEYLQDYTDRVKPLLDQNDLYGRVLTDFEKKWDSGTFPGWPVGSPFRCHHRWWFCSPLTLRATCLVERGEQCSDACRSSSGPLCFLFVGGKIFSLTHTVTATKFQNVLHLHSF